MTDRDRPQVAIDDEFGRPLAGAEIELVDPTGARASLHVVAGHLPMGLGPAGRRVLGHPRPKRQWVEAARLGRHRYAEPGHERWVRCRGGGRSVDLASGST